MSRLSAKAQSVDLRLFVRSVCIRVFLKSLADSGTVSFSFRGYRSRKYACNVCIYIYTRFRVYNKNLQTRTYYQGRSEFIRYTPVYACTRNYVNDTRVKSWIRNKEIARYKNANIMMMRTIYASVCVCVCGVCGCFREALVRLPWKIVHGNPNWAWLGLIYLVAQRRDKVPVRLGVVVAPLYRQLFTCFEISSFLRELVRSPRARGINSTKKRLPDNIVSRLSFGLFEGERGRGDSSVEK